MLTENNSLANLRSKFINIFKYFQGVKLLMLEIVHSFFHNQNRIKQEQIRKSITSRVAIVKKRAINKEDTADECAGGHFLLSLSLNDNDSTFQRI